MPKILKSFVTQSGFFELAIAAPSMKAAVDAWGLPANIFQQGFAQETNDPAIIASTLAQPGTVLKRAVGSKGAFKETAELPKSLPAGSATRPIAPKKKAIKAKQAPKTKPTKAAEPAQIHSFKRAQAKRDAARVKEEAQQERQEAAKAREEERRQRAVDKAQAILDLARASHVDRMKEIERERTAVERKADTEVARWEKEKRALERKLHHARQ
jgi:colicin import membrane protein